MNRPRSLFDLPAWRLRLEFWLQRWSYAGWCLVLGHKAPVWKHHGAPVVPPLLVCPRCGKFSRAE
jgi:hypothetical protein